MVDNFLYQIAHYGKVLNANRTYYLTRSQPPFLTSMVLAVYRALPRDDADPGPGWRRVLLAAIREYRDGLDGPGPAHHRDRPEPLRTRAVSGMPPEVEKEHFDADPSAHDVEQGLDGVRTYSRRLYKAGARSWSPALDAYFVHDRTMRESGHDTTQPLVDGLRPADFVHGRPQRPPLQGTRSTSRASSTSEFGGSPGRWHDGIRERDVGDWHAAPARRRRPDRQATCWDERRGMFFDYDFVNGRRTSYESATDLLPALGRASGRPRDG